MIVFDIVVATVCLAAVFGMALVFPMLFERCVG